MFRSAKRKAGNRSARRRGDDKGEGEENLKETIGFVSSQRNKGENGKSDEDEEEDPTIVVRRSSVKSKSRRKSKEKGSKSGLRSSFTMDFEDDNGNDGPDRGKKKEKSDRKRKRSRKGLGFGGADVESNDGDQEMEVDSTLFSSYGLHELEKLRSEQLIAKKIDPEETPAEAEAKPEPPEEIVQEVPPPERASPPKDHPKESTQISEQAAPLYIPLDDGEIFVPDTDMHILAGDEALEAQHESEAKYDNVKGGEGLPPLSDAPEKDNLTKMVEETEDVAWEEQISKRAGLMSLKTRTNPSNRTGMTNFAAAKVHNLPSLDELRSNLQATLRNMKGRQEDLDNAIMRRQAQLAHAQSELVRNEESLKATGKGYDFYQALRVQLATWTGAVRELKAKIDPVQETLLNLLVTQDKAAQSQWCEWQDDMCSILHDAGQLDRIMGRQPELPTSEATVDEFGRDVQSQHVRLRDKRCRERLSARRGEEVNQSSDFVSNILFWSERKIKDWDDQYHELQKSLVVALEDVEEEFTSIDSLKSIFLDWKEKYPDEYSQCYAYMSFADLASILVKIDISRSSWLSFMLLRHQAHGDYEINQDTLVADKGPEDELLSWVEQIESVDVQRDDPTTEGPVERILEKSLVPLLSGLLSSSSFFLISSRKSHLLSRCFAKVINRLLNRNKEQLISKLQNLLLDSIKEAFGMISVPIIKSTGIEEEEDEMLRFAKNSSRDLYPKCLQQLVLNIIKYWAPVTRLRPQAGSNNAVDSDLVLYVLQFVSSTFLFLLSSLPISTARTAFAPIWNALQEDTNWLQNGAFMLQAAPIRAAASAYGLS